MTESCIAIECYRRMLCHQELRSEGGLQGIRRFGSRGLSRDLNLWPQGMHPRQVVEAMGGLGGKCHFGILTECRC